MCDPNPYDTTIDTRNVFPGLAENSEEKWKLAAALQQQLAEEGIEVSKDACGFIVSTTLRQLRVVLNIARPDCLGEFANELLKTISSICDYGPFEPEEHEPMRSVVEASLHSALAHILGADQTAETKSRAELLGQH